jgi:hypothetical protein
MKKILQNDSNTKEYFKTLTKIYGLFLWAKWGMLELYWSGKLDERGMPLVYVYYDANGTCDEYRLMPIDRASSGGFWSWYMKRSDAECIQKNLNSKMEKNQ